MARRKGAELTPGERRFVRTMARTGDVIYSAKAAGYANADKNGYGIIQRPEVSRAVIAEQLRILAEQGTPMALAAILHILDPNNTSAPYAVKFQAAKYALDNAKDAMTSSDQSIKPPEDMTADELRAEEARLKALSAVLEAALAAKAVLVDGEVVDDAAAPNLGGVFD